MRTPTITRFMRSQYQPIVPGHALCSMQWARCVLHRRPAFSPALTLPFFRRPIAFPGSAQSRVPTFHGSPVLHDVNEDGLDDVCVVDSDGVLYWAVVGELGEYV